MRLPGFENVRPPKPTRYDEPVARRIAERLIREIDPDLKNGDERGFYWTLAELPELIWELQQAIMADIPEQRLIWYCRNTFDKTHWRLEGITESCRFAASIVIRDEVAAAVKRWIKQYEVVT